jgi:hypothetical protein
MLKSHLLRNFLKCILAIAILAGVFRLTARREDGSAALPATVNRDCAPWDGSAFIISIPPDRGQNASVVISIWQAPDVRGPRTFSFPDETGHIGSATYRPAAGDPEPLRGQVSLFGVDRGHPIEGTFYLGAEDGTKFSGTFNATWGSAMIFCG